MPRRIVVKGTSGAGKSTFAAELARRLNLSYIELDSLHWGPNWSEPSPEAFRACVRAAMASAPDGWVIDGNYDSRLGDTVTGEADTIVWLDLPLWIKLRWLWGRTMHRTRSKVELWNGNRETWRGAFFSRDSLFVWMLQTHFRHRRDWPSRFAGDPRMVRLQSEAEVRRWLEEQSMDETVLGNETLDSAKAENPFDLLAEHAIREHEAGRTKSLRDFAAENYRVLDDE